MRAELSQEDAEKIKAIHDATVGTVCTSLAEALTLASASEYYLSPEELVYIMSESGQWTADMVQAGFTMVAKVRMPRSEIRLNNIKSCLRKGLALSEECGQPVPLMRATTEALKHTDSEDVAGIYDSLHEKHFGAFTLESRYLLEFERLPNSSGTHSTTSESSTSISSIDFF